MIRITDGYENEIRNTAISRIPNGNEDQRTLKEIMEMMQ